MRALVIVLLQGHVLEAVVADKGYQKIPCEIVPIITDGKLFSHPRIPGPKKERATSAKSQSTSTNWGGYVGVSSLINPLKNSVSAVYGSWIVPAIKASVNSSYSAIWIGIDGYNSSTVEQIGTGHDYINGVAQHYAWFEMYPGGSFLINNFPVNVGDVISASVEYTSNNIFILRLYNDTKKVSFTVPTSYTTLSSPADRSSAEWIVEAPYFNGILPLANFSTDYMWGCRAKIKGVLANIKNTSWSNIAVTMVKTSAVNKAVPSDILPDNGSFFITWKQQ
jgi:hypothetical protein